MDMIATPFASPNASPNASPPFNLSFKGNADSADLNVTGERFVSCYVSCTSE